MSLSVDYLYQFALNLIKKNQAGGLVSKEFERHWNDSQSSYMDDLLGRFQARNNGKEGANTGLIENETILQKLSPFIKTTIIIKSDGSNLDKPTDFIYRLAFRVEGSNARKINYNQIADANSSVIDPPDQDTNTIYFVEYENYYSVLPSTVDSIELDYVSTPANIVWGYTWDANDRQIYNSGTSTQPLWDNSSCREITKRMLTNLGVSFKDQDFESFGKSVQITGE